jgi:SMODS domain-containing protein
MATKTVDEGFRDFLVKLTPSGTETASAKKHRESILTCLKRKYTVNRFFRTGSFGNGTSISGYSDVDYFASIARDQLKSDSGKTLTEMKNQLQGCFPRTTVKVDSPAVVLDFGTADWETHEVVPADYIRKENSHSVYDIPDGVGGWIKSSPENHNAYIQSLDKKLDNKLRPLIRFIKAWKFYRNVPISSFYLELRTAEYASGETYILYSSDVKGVLGHLKSKGLASIRDPKGISGLIPACSTNAKKQDALSKLDTAYTRACNARNAERNEDIKDAFDWWDLLYDGKFPSYYK